MKLCGQLADPFEQVSEHSSSINTRPYLNNPVYKKVRVPWIEIS